MTLAEQYIEKGRQKGLAEAQRADILEVLDIRFGEVPERLREAVEGMSGSPRLRELYRATIRAATLEEFAQAL